MFVVLSTEFHIAHAKYSEIYTHISCTAPEVSVKLVRDRKNLLWPDKHEEKNSLTISIRVSRIKYSPTCIKQLLKG